MVAHANNKKNGEELLKLILNENKNIIESHILELGGALGAHAGPGALAVGIQELD